MTTTPSHSPASSGGSSTTASPENHSAPAATNFQLLKRMLKFLRPVIGTTILCGVLIVAWVVAETFINKSYGNIIDAAADTFKNTSPADGFWHTLVSGNNGKLFWLIVFLAFLVISNCVIRYFRWVMDMKFTMDMVYHMRASVYDRLQRVGFSFHDEHSSGQLINRALSDLQNVRSFLQTAAVSIVEIVTVVISFNILIFTISPWLALVACLPIPFWIFYIARYSKKMQPTQRAQMTAGDDLVTVFTENAAGVHVVKAFATQPTEVKKYNSTADKFYDAVMRTVLLQRNFSPTVSGIAAAGHLIMFAVGAVFIVNGLLKVGDLVIFGGAMWQILSRLQQVTQLADQYQKAIVSARRFYEVLDAPDTVPEAPDAKELPLTRGGGGVEFNFVTFGYSADKPVVKDISFEIKPGGVVALVGPTGAGKSTIIQLLGRFYDPQKGHILIDGIDVRKVKINSLRRQIGFVFQETFLFSDTVANNIRYGNPDATIGEIEAAARIAQAHEFIIELRNGYDTMLGERGASLSGGQRQRLAIARAIVSNPRILVLDDALAAVDPETEHLISRALELVMVDRTVFIVAHRLSTVKAADLVIVLENGRITQAGTHKELMRMDGHYRHIAEVQLAYQEKEIIAEAQKQKDILDASHHGMPAQH